MCEIADLAKINFKISTANPKVLRTLSKNICTSSNLGII